MEFTRGQELKASDLPYPKINGGLVSINREESVSRTILEYNYTFLDDESLAAATSQLTYGVDEVVEWRTWKGFLGQWQLSVIRVIPKEPDYVIHEFGSAEPVHNLWVNDHPGPINLSMKERALLAHKPRRLATRIAINPNLRLGPVLTVAEFQDADGECVPGRPVEVYEYVSGMVGTGVIESIDLPCQYVYIAVDWGSITIEERT